MNEQDKLYFELGANDKLSPIIEKILQDSEKLQENFDNFKKITIKDITLKADGALTAIKKQIQESLNAEPFTISIAPDADTSRVVDAARAIIEAQNKIMSAAKGANVEVGTSGTNSPGTEGTNTTNTQAARENAEAVQQQAKSYEELRAQVDAVLGSLEKNTATIVEERNAISLIDKEMKIINRDVEKQGSMTENQRKRLEQLTAARERHKQTLQNSTQSLRNDIKLAQAAGGSMNELSQSLGRMRMAYRSMTEEQRNSDFGKELLASIQKADTKIKELDATIGNHQRNVGNYFGRSYNGLNMSLQQIIRELPNASMGFGVFTLAISNNIPILADQIKMAKEAAKAQKEMGQVTTPVWKQLLSSLFSWQTALILGVTLLTVYGKEIGEWAKGLFTGSRAAISAADATEKLNEQLEKNDGKFSDNAMSVKNLASEWKKLKNEAEKTAWIEANQSSFDAMGLSIRDVTSAERAFVENTGAVVEALKSRARAEAARELAKEKYKEAFLKREEAKQEEKKGVSLTDKIAGSMAQISTTGTGNFAANKQGASAQDIAKGRFEQRVKNLNDEADTLEKEIDVYYDIARLEDEKSKSELKRLGILKEQNKTRKEQLQAQKANIQAQLDLLNEEDAAGAKGEELRKKISDLDKRLAAYSSTKSDKADKDAARAAAKAKRESEKRGDAAEKRASILTRQTVTAQRAAIDTELSTRQAEIGAMEESTEKVLLQIKLDEEKKLEAIRREYEDLKIKRIEEAKKLWDVDPKNKGFNFYESESYKQAASDSQYTKAQKENRAAREKEVAAVTKRSEEKALLDRKKLMNDYLREYGSIQQKRAAISDEYNQKIEKAHSAFYKATLTAERDRLLSDLDLKELQKQINWEDVFRDIDKYSVKYLAALKEKLQAALNAKDITAENAKVLSEKIAEIEKTIAGKTSIWQALLPGLRERKRVTEQTAKAQSDLNKAQEEEAKANQKVNSDRFNILQELQKGGISASLSDITEANKETMLASLEKGSELYNALLKLFENLAADNATAQGKQLATKQAKSALDAQWEKLKGMNGITDLFSFASGNPLEIIEGVNANVQSFAEMVDNFGLEGTDFGNAVHNFAEGCTSFKNVINDLASGNVIGAVNDVLSGVSSWAQVFYAGGNEQELEKEIEQLSKSNDRLAEAINSLSDRIKDIDATSNESEAAFREAYKAEKEWEANQRKAINDRASEWTNTGYGFLGMGGKSSFNTKAPGASWNGWREFNRILQAHGYNSRVSSAGSLWNLTPEEMKLLRDFAPTQWKQLFETDGHKNPEELVNAYIERAGMLDELTDAINEKLTGYSWDNFKGSFVDTLKDLTSTTEDFADNIEDLLTNAILNSLINETYKDRIKALYQMIADAAGEDSEGGSTFTAGELQGIREANEALAADLIAARNALKDAGVLKETDGSSSSRNSIMGQTITENTASLLSGYINAIRADTSINRGILTQLLQVIQQGGTEMPVLAQAQLRELQLIASNTNLIADFTRQNAQYASDIKDQLHRFANGVDKITMK